MHMQLNNFDVGFSMSVNPKFVDLIHRLHRKILQLVFEDLHFVYTFV